MNRHAPIRRFQALLAALFTLAAITRLPAATYHPLLTNGPAANRFNVALLPEGYTAAELDQFLLDAATAVNALLAYEPYREYRACFNAAAIAVASAQSGSDHPLHGIQPDTYFNSSYDPVGDYVITLPNDATGVGKLDALIQQFMPDNDLVILLVNDPAPGGSGGPRLITSKNAAWIEFLVHESGHTVGGLGDEYDYAVPGFTYPDLEFPNTTTNTNPATLKWKAWIEPGTPIPTPADFAWWNVIGLFEGAQYSPTNWYRPKYDCLMRSVYSWSAFCEVCQESLVRAFYGVVRPVDQHLPASTNLDVYSPEPIQFNLALLQPAAATLRVQWWTNNVAIPGATNAVLDLTPAALGDGRHRIEARVRDHTAKVRTDPDARLAQVITWHLDVQLRHLRLDPPRLLPEEGAGAIRISGNAPGDVVLLHSTNLATWFPLATNRLHSGEWIHTNPAALYSPPTFFRALTRP